MQTFIFGYKDHILYDRRSKLVTDYAVTDAAVHDSQLLDELTTLGIAQEQELYAATISASPFSARYNCQTIFDWPEQI